MLWQQRVEAVSFAKSAKRASAANPSKKSLCISEEESSPICRRMISPGSSDGGKSPSRLRSATTITAATPTTTTLSCPQDSGTSPSTDSSSSTRGVLASAGSPLTDESDARSGLPMEGAEAVLPSMLRVAVKATSLRPPRLMSTGAPALLLVLQCLLQQPALPLLPLLLRRRRRRRRRRG